MARDFLSTWRKAAFRGVEFWVDTDQVETGRALIVHEFPHRDEPFVEDMGRVANKIQVTAYLASDDVVAESARLFSACGQGGAARLDLPMERLKVHCDSCRRDWARDRQGYVAFALAFVKDGGAGPAPYSAPYLSRLVATSALALSGPLQARFAALFSTAGRAGFVAAAAVASIRDGAALLSAVRSALPLDPAKNAALVRSIDALHASAESYAAVGPVTDIWRPDHFMTAPDKGSAPDLAGDVAAILETMRGAAAPDVFAQEVTLLAGFDSGAQPRTTPSRIAMADNIAAVESTVRTLALAQWAAAVCDIELTDRRQAIGLRADVAERFDAELATLAGADAASVFVALSDVRGHAVQYLTRSLADLKPVVVAEAQVALPSLYWSHALYGTAARAEELTKRNRAFHASFLPQTIEAVAP